MRLRRELGRYAGAWRDLRRRRTLLQLGLDALLLLGLLLLWGIDAVAWQAIVAPLTPALQAVARLEAMGNATQADRLALVGAYRPDVQGVLLKGTLVTVALVLLAVLLYALLKTRAWSALRKERFPWPRLWRNALFTLAALILALGLPALLLNASPRTAVAVFLGLAALALLAVPLRYASPTLAGAWRAVRRDPLAYLFRLLLLIVTQAVALELLGLVAAQSAGVGASLLVAWLLVSLSWGRAYLLRFMAKGVGHGH